MFSSPEVKDPIILDPGKKVTENQSTWFETKSLISQVIGRIRKFKYVTDYFWCYTIFDRLVTWILLLPCLSQEDSQKRKIYPYIQSSGPVHECNLCYSYASCSII